MDLSDTGALLLLLGYSSILLLILISGVLLLIRYRRYRLKTILCASLFFLLQAVAVMALIATSVSSGTPSTPFKMILQPLPLIAGFFELITMVSYTFECKRPGCMSRRHLAIMITPLVILSTACIISGCHTMLQSKKDIWANLQQTDVLLRLSLAGSYIVYGFAAALAPSRRQGNHIPERHAVALSAFDATIPFTFLCGMILGIFPAAVANAMLIVFLDLFIIYVELVVRMPVRQEDDTVKNVEDNGMFDSEAVWKDPDMTAVDLAEMMHLNRTRLSQMIKDAGYSGYNDMVNHKRVNYICSKLAENEHSDIIQIMYDSGFRSRSSASAAFKNIVGCTPTEYAKAHRRG